MTDVRWIDDNVPTGKFPFWTRANVGEVLPEPPSPLGWELAWKHGTLPGWADCNVEHLGMGPDELDANRPEVVGVFGGYAYLGATIIRVWAERTPGMSADIIDGAYFGDHPDVPVYAPEPWHVREETTAHMERWLGWAMTATEQPLLEEEKAIAEQVRASRPDLSSLTDGELIERAKSFTPLIRRMFKQHINQSGAASIGLSIIGAVAEAVGDPTLTLRLVGGLGDVDSAAPSYEMWTMSRLVRSDDRLRAAFDEGPIGLTARLGSTEGATEFLAALDGFLGRFGSRGPNEWDIHAHTWETDPDLVLAAVDRMRLAGDEVDPSAGAEGRDEDRRTLAASVAAMVEADPEAHGQFMAAMQSSSVFVPGRERSKTTIIKVIHEVRMAMYELGSRHAEAAGFDRVNDICLLFEDELTTLSADPGSLADIVAGRRGHLAYLRTLEPPFIINGAPAALSEWQTKEDASKAEVATPGTVIAGIPGCPGVLKGVARVVLDPSDPTVLGPGEILIAPHTDPAWTPLFVSAGAVVVDVGAPLSHAIIVSREFGLPCVVSATDATKRIPDGAEIEVNGDTGQVTVL